MNPPTGELVWSGRARWLGRLHDGWLHWRDRWLASPAFQRRASAFALTRPTASRHARELFDLVAGFVYSQVLSACVELELFERLARGPQSAEQLSARLDVPLEPTQRLLAAATAIRLLERRSDGRYGLGRRGAPMVGNAAVAAMVRHHSALYADLADPLKMLRAGERERREGALARYWAYDQAHDTSKSDSAKARVQTYSTLMAASQPLVAEQILDAYRMNAHHCLLDVGGGDGRFLETVAARVPDLRLQLFDLPAVAPLARTRFANAGITARAEVHGGSFLADALPRGADIATLIRVIHDHDDAAAMTILRAVHRALPRGGTVLLAEPMADTPGAEAMGDAYFGIYLFAMGHGRPRSAARLTQMLAAAGFEQVRPLRTTMPLQTGLLAARATGVNTEPVDVNAN